MTKLLVPFVLLLLFGHPALAGDPWKQKTAFARSGSTGIKILEPSGFKVAVTINGDVKADTIPARFALPEDDGFYTVTVTAPSGEAWTQKVEARRFQTTELTLSYEAAAAPAAAGGGRTYVGSAVNRVTDCGHRFSTYAARFDFMTDAKDPVASVQVQPGAMAQANVPRGSYDIRIYVWDGGANTWVYQLTGKGEVSKDRWSATMTCANKGQISLAWTN